MQRTPTQLRQATNADIPRLVDVFFEAFHPVSPYMRQAQPDTMIVRKFWDTTFRQALDDPELTVMVVVDCSVEPHRIIALGRFRLSPPSASLDAGQWSRIPWTEDHDVELCDGFASFLASCRQKMMHGVEHYFIELLATSHLHKQTGAGRLLLEWVCRQADQNHIPIFVETNGDIVSFYEKFDFEVKERLIMPGGHGYEEFIMIRDARNDP
jgi:hypothetical protein